jgi:hypothetical protein
MSGSKITPLVDLNVFRDGQIDFVNCGTKLRTLQKMVGVIGPMVELVGRNAMATNARLLLLLQAFTDAAEDARLAIAEQQEGMQRIIKALEDLPQNLAKQMESNG